MHKIGGVELSMPIESFPIISFAVCRDAVINGQRILGLRLSREFATMDEADQARAQILEQFPDAGIVSSTRFF